MIIYLEGADGTGKSTLADYIQGALNEVIYLPHAIIEARDDYDSHPDSPTRMTKKEIFSVLKHWAKDSKVHILDRGPLSDIIYRMFDDKKPICSMPELLRFVNEFGNRVMLVHCDANTSESNMKSRGDDNPISHKYHNVIRKAYDIMFDLIREMTPNVIKYDYDKKSSINEVLGRVSYFVYIAKGGE